LGIVGESGSGKSVSSLSVMRLIEQPGQIEGGQIIFKDGSTSVDLLQLSEKEIQKIRGNKIAMIFQEPMSSLNPAYKCGKQVTEAILIQNKFSKAEAKAKTIDLFKKVQLPSPERMFNSYPHQLSGGQLQRVMIAMAISCNPDIIIADEPTTALDVTVQKEILELLKSLAKENHTSIIFISHDLGVIHDIANEVLVMYKGKVMEQATVQSIFKNPKHPYTKGLLACRPALHKKIQRLPVVSDFMKVEHNADGSFEIVAKAIESSKPERQRNTVNYVAPPLLSVEALNTWYPKKKSFFGKPISYLKAVNNVSFDVHEGEIVGLVGESGCGKSTLGRTLIKLTKAVSGSAIYKGKNIVSISEKEMKPLRKEIQIIFQDPYSSLNPRMKIGEAIMEPMQVHNLYDNDNQRKEKVIDLLETVSLNADHFDRYPHEFSGGQRQRISIARTLAVNPKFIICDECVSALDVSVQAQVLNLLLDLRDQFNLTYIFISHDLSVVRFISDRIMVMKDGEIIEMGNAEDVYTNPKKE
ncbi:MAG: ABC transporter ATP-binding protein, partial [Bacteroidota bacterium]